jgi:hypothetical protein
MKLGAVILPLFALSAAAQEPEPAKRSGVAARINAQVITWDDVELEITNSAKLDPDQRTPEVRRVTLRRLALDALYLQEARNYGIEVSEAQVDADVEAERKRGGLTPDGFQNYVNNQLGMSLTEFRAQKRRDRTVAMVLSRLATEPLRNPNAKLRLLLDFVSPEEMHDFYVANRSQFKEIRQVDVFFLKMQFQNPAEREEKIRLSDSVRRRVQEGSPLLWQAVAYMDPALMPLKGRDRVPMYENLDFEQAPFSDEIKDLLYVKLKEGEVSETVVDGNMVCLFQLRRRIDMKERTFEDAQPLIRRKLESDKRQYNEKVLRADLVRRAYIEPPDLLND